MLGGLLFTGGGYLNQATAVGTAVGTAAATAVGTAVATAVATAVGKGRQRGHWKGQARGPQTVPPQGKLPWPPGVVGTTPSVSKL